VVPIDQRDVRDVFQAAGRWLGNPATAVATFALTVAVYAALAPYAPGVGSIATSVLGFVGALSVTLLVNPAPEKITAQRQIEVFGFRVAVALVGYLLFGAVLLWVFNQLLAGVTPLAPPAQGFWRSVAWPFQALTHVSCSTGLPSPPDACSGFT
jgi:hypothetical protein